MCFYFALAKEVQLFPGLRLLVGLYSEIFAMHLQCSSNKSRKAIIYLYTPCLPYVLSTATIVGDLVALMPTKTSLL